MRPYGEELLSHLTGPNPGDSGKNPRGKQCDAVAGIPWWNSQGRGFERRGANENFLLFVRASVNARCVYGRSRIIAIGSALLESVWRNK